MAHYLIDYENIHNIRGCKKLGENDTIVFFYSATANVISIDLHLELVKTQAKTEFLLVKKASANSKNTTKNALDFQLSSYVGFLLAKFPKEKIYIVSKDKGYETVEKFLLPFIINEIANLKGGGVGADAKTLLQQFVQQAEGDFLEYEVVKESGPDHMKTFEVEARLNSNVIGRGKGRSKREAEQNAAKEALALFNFEGQ